MTVPDRKAAETGGHSGASIEESREWVRSNLRRVSDAMTEEGFPRPALDGKLLRPLAAYLTVPTKLRDSLDLRFWSGALAVEMVHEASLLHDDILDEAPQRRGKPTMVSRTGVGPPLVLGDHLLTAAYRFAMASESPAFLSVFIRSVERTVAGEFAQERSQGDPMAEDEYLRVITGKSGELFRAAFTLPAALLEVTDPEAAGALGADMGRLYQMVDDFLDYCSHAERGKVPLQDYRQKKWTWPLGLIGVSDFERAEAEILSALFRRPGDGESSPMEVGARRIVADFDNLIRNMNRQGLETGQLQEVLRGWGRLAQSSAARESDMASVSMAGRYVPSGGLFSSRQGVPEESDAILRQLKSHVETLEEPDDWIAYFSRHARSFRFAARLFPRQELERVAGVYAFCRFTDDLVDEAGDTDRNLLAHRLDLWLLLARKAYQGDPTGVPLLDGVMGDMRRSGVPFRYAEELVEGVRMDLHPSVFRTMEDLRSYTYRVASVVGGWLTELFGIRDPWVLDRAFALGHAMQITNILRDVGEDLRSGRLYLPAQLMERCGVERSALEASLTSGAPAPSGYRGLLETMMAEAEADYRRAFEGIPALPSFFRGPVAVAANVYQGIHAEIRRNGFDNLNRRARTSFFRKLVLGARGLRALRQAVRRSSILREANLGHPRYGREETGEAAA